MNGAPEYVWDFVKPLTGSLRVTWDENVACFEVVQSITDVSLPQHGSPPAPVEAGRGRFWGKGSVRQTPSAHKHRLPAAACTRCQP